MCFSATASFTATALLVPVGIYASKVALAKDARYLPLAVFSLAFGIQQGFEGLEWLGLDGNRQPSRHGLAGGDGLFILLPWILASLASLDDVHFRASTLGQKVAAGYDPYWLFIRRLPIWAIPALS